MRWPGGTGTTPVGTGSGRVPHDRRRPPRTGAATAPRRRRGGPSGGGAGPARRRRGLRGGGLGEGGGAQQAGGARCRSRPVGVSSTSSPSDADRRRYSATSGGRAFALGSRRRGRGRRGSAPGPRLPGRRLGAHEAVPAPPPTGSRSASLASWSTERMKRRPRGPSSNSSCRSKTSCAPPRRGRGRAGAPRCGRGARGGRAPGSSGARGEPELVVGVPGRHVPEGSAGGWPALTPAATDRVACGLLRG